MSTPTDAAEVANSGINFAFAYVNDDQQVQIQSSGGANISQLVNNQNGLSTDFVPLLWTAIYAQQLWQQLVAKYPAGTSGAVDMSVPSGSLILTAPLTVSEVDINCTTIPPESDAVFGVPGLNKLGYAWFLYPPRATLGATYVNGPIHWINHVNTRLFAESTSAIGVAWIVSPSFKGNIIAYNRYSGNTDPNLGGSLFDPGIGAIPPLVGGL